MEKGIEVMVSFIFIVLYLATSTPVAKHKLILFRFFFYSLIITLHFSVPVTSKSDDKMIIHLKIILWFSKKRR